MCGSWNFTSTSLLSILNFEHLFFSFCITNLVKRKAYSEPSQKFKKDFLPKIYLFFIQSLTAFVKSFFLDF